MNQFFCRIENFPVNHATVRHDDGEPRLTIIEDDGARMQLVVDVRAFVVVHIAVDGDTHPRGDVRRRSARAKLF